MKSSRLWWRAGLGLAVLLGAAQVGWGQELSFGTYPTRVLITNDNGIDDPKIVALAQAFSEVAETWVVAPSQDRSGSGSYLVVASQGFLDIEERDLGPGIRAFAVDGYPADCVVLALAGLMLSSPPDLVVSGINGGENAGGDWMFSGTVGAARVAAFAGVPSLAVSGLDDDLPGAVEAAVDWVVRLARSEVVRDMEPHAYLTVSMPRTVPDSIMGVRITDRAPLMAGPEIAAVSPTSWQIVGQQTVRSDAPSDSDVSALDEKFIAVVPMRLDEVDIEVLTRWRRVAPSLPGWP
jgi:5'-nucleotidase